MTRPPIEVTHPPQHEVQSSPSLQAWGKMVSPSLGHEHALGSSGGSPHHLRRTHQILDVDAGERCGKRYLRLGQHRHHHARQQSDFTTALSSSSSTFLIARAMSSAVIWRAARKKAKGVHALVHGPDRTWNFPNTQSGSGAKRRVNCFSSDLSVKASRRLSSQEIRSSPTARIRTAPSTSSSRSTASKPPASPR